MDTEFFFMRDPLIHEIAEYASAVIILVDNFFEKALDMFLKAYRAQAKARVQNKEEDVAHMETCKCFVQEDLLLVSVSMMFRKLIQNRDFLGFWDDAIVDTVKNKQIYIHMTFVILCDITVRFWDDYVLDMSLYENYICPSISRWHIERDRKATQRAFNRHYFKVFSWIDCRANIFEYDLSAYTRTPTHMSFELLCPDHASFPNRPKKRDLSAIDEETYPMNLN
jgi:hypothetical protein